MSHLEQIIFFDSIKKKYPNYFFGKIVVDIGSLDINGSNRDLFNQCLYLGVDLAPGRNVDLICSGHELDLPDCSVDVVISSECFEHDMNYRKTLNNILRMLKPGGLFVFSCATTGRKEHGTRRTTPNDSPLTQQFDEWSDYYKNLTEADIRKVFNVEGVFQEFEFSINEQSHDMYFFGIKRGDLIERDNYSFIESAHPENIIALSSEITELKRKLLLEFAETVRLSEWATERNQKALELEEVLVNKQSELMKISDWAVDLRESRGLLEGKLTDKHAELMCMSDWASGMRDELSYLKKPWFEKLRIQSKPLVGRYKLLIKSNWLFKKLFISSGYKDDNQMLIEEAKLNLQANNKSLILIFPIIDWGFRHQRPQHFTIGLRDKGFTCLYLDMKIQPIYRALKNSQEANDQILFSKIDDGIYQFGCLGFDELNVYKDDLNDINLKNATHSIENILGQLGAKKITYFVQFPGWWPIVKSMMDVKPGRVVFDCMDNHSGFSTNSAKVLAQEELLLERADLVVSSSDLLESICKAKNSKTIQIKNAAEFKHFSNPRKNGLLDYVENNPVIGYFGAISEWFDVDLLYHCAKNNPDWSFVLIGSTFGASIHMLERLKNVYFIGEKPYSDLPGYFAYFDVCIIPFVINELTKATNPVKFYEYISAGKPVVSTMLPELLPYSEYCYLAESAEEFSSKISAALADVADSKKIESRIKLAQKNSWGHRIDELVQSEYFQQTNKI